MIPYNKTAFGLNLVLRIHGSAVYRAILPSCFSVGIFLLLRQYYSQNGMREDLGHPYAIGALVASASFLVVFRANQGYARYWEAASATHHMMSKWMDATIHTGVYHLQCDHYDTIKPPSYYDYPELNHLYLTRDRERGVDYTEHSEEEEPEEPPPSQLRNRLTRSLSVRPPKSGSLHWDKAALQEERVKRRLHAVHKSINFVPPSKTSGFQSSKRSRSGPASTFHLHHHHHSTHGSSDPIQMPRSLLRRNHSLPDLSELSEHGTPRVGEDSIPQDKDDDDDSLPPQFPKGAPGNGKPFPLWGKPRCDGNWGAYYTDSSLPNGGKPFRLATFFHPSNPSYAGPDPPLPPEGFASTQGGRTPPLFLQELAHLASLSTAVALSTLRNDIEGAESPLAYYQPGSEWPTVDPDKDAWIKISGVSKYQKFLWSFLGMSISPEEQTRYNAGRPLPVIGGVSDAEIRFLQMARGPYAKTQLCWSWLSEFIIREHLAGTLGAVGPPIISRIIQFLGDGMIYYNHARKITFIPFPFVHAQLSIIFVLVLIPVIPFLMEQYTEEVWLGCALTFFTVMSLAGINEVARELENPFRNVPNELPLVTMMAQFNEALLTMYSGYHPDHYWDGKRVLQKRSPGVATSAADTKAEPKEEDDRRDSSDDLLWTGTGERGEAPLQAIPPTTLRTTNSTRTSLAPPTKNSSEEEVARLRQQLEQQAALIEELFRRVESDPARATHQLDQLVSSC